eukprot:1139851-Pelagomonas_calceolata.AAC.5
MPAWARVTSWLRPCYPSNSLHEFTFFGVFLPALSSVAALPTCLHEHALWELFGHETLMLCQAAPHHFRCPSTPVGSAVLAPVGSAVLAPVGSAAVAVTVAACSPLGHSPESLSIQHMLLRSEGCCY